MVADCRMHYCITHLMSAIEDRHHVKTAQTCHNHDSNYFQNQGKW